MKRAEGDLVLSYQQPTFRPPVLMGLPTARQGFFGEILKLAHALHVNVPEHSDLCLKNPIQGEI